MDEKIKVVSGYSLNDIQGMVMDAELFFGGENVVSFFNETKTKWACRFTLERGEKFYWAFATKNSENNKWEVTDNFPWKQFEIERQ